MTPAPSELEASDGGTRRAAAGGPTKSMPAGQRERNFGRSAELIEALQRDPIANARQVQPDQEAVPPGVTPRITEPTYMRPRDPSRVAGFHPVE